jgi:septum formation protein
MNLTPRLLLASNSPRRQDLLRQAGFDFEIARLSVDESYPSDLAVQHIPEYLAQKKSQIARTQYPQHTIITADTVVICEDRVLEKPMDAEDAERMLHSISGKIHHVISGVCVAGHRQIVTLSDTTEVEFRNLSKNEITYYISHYAPMDKAGAYGIQEWIGMIGIKQIRGSYYNVVGLPLQKLYPILVDKFGISLIPPPR